MQRPRRVVEWTPEMGPFRETTLLDIIWDRDSESWLIVLPDRIIRLPDQGE